jgi:radical SAM superfamily enzyme YgiQ (UPF0313 family)
VDLFDSTNWRIPGESDFDSDKEKEKILTVRPFDDSILRTQLHETDVFEDFREKIITFNPDLIAVSVTEDLFPIAIMLLQAIRDIRVTTIMGGVFPTFAPEKCLAREEIDIVCIGEGEDALLELCNRMERGQPIADIPNLWIKNQDGIKKNLLGPPVNIDAAPLLDLSIFEESRLYRPMEGKVRRMLPVETHRGCPYQCSYCNSPAQQKLYKRETGFNQCRMKSIEVVHRDLKYYKEEIKAEMLFFWADTFLSYKEPDFQKFCEMYEDIRLPFWCHTRPETIVEGRVRRLMDLGLFRMSFGIEHGNYNFRKTILRRNMKNETIINAAQILKKCGINFSVNNIIGFPTETRELAMDTVRLNRQIESESANAFSFSPFHGTPLRKMSEELGFCDKNLIARSATKPTLLNMSQFPPEAIEGLRRCFTLYVRMPESRWKDIKKAEELSPAGDKIWEDLKAECQERYLPY